MKKATIDTLEAKYNKYIEQFPRSSFAEWANFVAVKYGIPWDYLRAVRRQLEATKTN